MKLVTNTSNASIPNAQVHIYNRGFDQLKLNFANNSVLIHVRRFAIETIVITNVVTIFIRLLVLTPEKYM